jgi:hypothetical protein
MCYSSRAFVVRDFVTAHICLRAFAMRAFDRAPVPILFVIIFAHYILDAVMTIALLLLRSLMPETSVATLSSDKGKRRSFWKPSVSESMGYVIDVQKVYHLLLLHSEVITFKNLCFVKF